MKKLVTVLAVMTATVALDAQAFVHLNILGGPNFENDSVTPPPASQTASAVLGMTYGATLELDFSPMFSLETGFLSVGSKTKFESAGMHYTQSMRLTEIPVLIRFTAFPLLDFGVGGYYATIPGTFQVEDSTFSGLANGTYNVPPNFIKRDYGLRGSVRLKLPLGATTRILADANYDYGLNDFDSSSTTQKHRSYSLLGGISLGF